MSKHPIPQRKPRNTYPSLDKFLAKLRKEGDTVLIKVNMPKTRIQSAAHNYAYRHEFTAVTKSEGAGIRVWRVG